AALEARRVLMNGDTVRAMELLERLTPSAPPADLEWQPWESFAPERLVLAQVLARRGEWGRAAAVAEQFDSPASVMYTMYAGIGLEIRVQAAEAMRNRVVADSMRARLADLRAR
ncbi:MAG TPA: hypothetical protein VJQ44_15755, partial [Gemmatimonadales bacterium]|nr:hypothetical protein [Gemmatimonadales bacterium]